MKTRSRAWLVALAVFALVPETRAASFAGRVTLPDGRPAVGAMLSVFNDAKNQKQTVYTGADGSYAIVTPYGGMLDVRARLANYDDSIVTLEAAPDQVLTLNLELKGFADAKSVSDALSASAHNARLVWERPDDRLAFVSQCNYCHQIGNATTRMPRSHEAWVTTIRKMEGYLVTITQAQKLRFAEALAAGFDGQLVEAVHDYGANAELARAKVEEWQVGDAFSFIHDLDVAADGKFYGTDEGHDILWVLDPRSGGIAPDQFSVLWRTPVLAGRRLPLVLTMPEGVENLKDPVVRELADSLVERRWVDARPDGLAGRRIEIAGLQFTTTDALVRVELLDGRTMQIIARPSLETPEACTGIAFGRPPQAARMLPRRVTSGHRRSESDRQVTLPIRSTSRAWSHYPFYPSLVARIALVRPTEYQALSPIIGS